LVGKKPGGRNVVTKGACDQRVRGHTELDGEGEGTRVKQKGLVQSRATSLRELAQWGAQFQTESNRGKRSLRIPHRGQKENGG